MKKSLVEFLEETDEGEIKRDRQEFIKQLKELLEADYFDFNAVNKFGENALMFLAVNNSWGGFKLYGDMLNIILDNTDLMQDNGRQQSFLMLALKHDKVNLKLTSGQYDTILSKSNIRNQYLNNDNTVYDALRYYMIFPYANDNFTEKHLNILVNKTINSDRDKQSLENILDYLYQDDHTFEAEVSMFEHIWPYIEDKNWFIQLLKEKSSPLINKPIVQKYSLEGQISSSSNHSKINKI